MTLTNHAKIRMNQRIITLQDIYNTVKCGTPTSAKNNLTCYTYDNIYVILDPNTNTVITAWHAKLNNIGFYAAIKQLRRIQIVS